MTQAVTGTVPSARGRANAEPEESEAHGIEMVT